MRDYTWKSPQEVTKLTPTDKFVLWFIGVAWALSVAALFIFA